MPYRVLATRNNYEVMREYTPCRRTIRIGAGCGCDLPRKWLTLSFPYIVFYWTNPELYIGFAKSPVTSIQNLLYCPTIGNVYEYWRVCGCAIYKKNPGISQISKAINLFWNKEFTSDGTDGPNALVSTFSLFANRQKQKININEETVWGGATQRLELRNNSVHELEKNDRLLYETWAKLNIKQVIKKLYYNPRTLKNFIASPLSGEYDELSIIPPRNVTSELNIKLTLDSEYEQLLI